MKRLPTPIFDTDVFISYRKEVEEYFDLCAVTAIVLYELSATSIKDDDLKRLEQLKEAANKDGRLYVPTLSDWWETAKMIKRLRALNLTSKTTTATELQNDGLNVRLAWDKGCCIVTNDVDDYGYLKKVLPASSSKPELLIVPAAYFFAE